MNLLKIIFLVKGIASKIPIKSVAKPGNINKKAANAKVAPETISYIGNSFLINCLIPQSHHIILIGPEGDFTSHELRKAMENGYQPISLGKKILRTETAGIMSAVSVNLIHHY